MKRDFEMEIVTFIVGAMILHRSQVFTVYHPDKGEFCSGVSFVACYYFPIRKISLNNSSLFFLFLARVVLCTELTIKRLFLLGKMQSCVYRFPFKLLRLFQSFQVFITS